MTDMLQEFCDSRGVSMRVDRQAGVIHGVKVLGLESRNGRTYLPEALAQAARLYEDAKVNVNHPKGNPTGPRDYQDRIGTIRRVTVRPEGLFGDFHFNPKHALAEQLMWDAERAPENVGFSHNVEARVARRGDRVVVEAITRVQSVDLVADPATTRGLFEATAEQSVTGSAIESCAANDGVAVVLPPRICGYGSTTAAPTATCATGSVSATSLSETAKPLTLDDLKRDHPELVEGIRQEQSVELEQLRQEVDRLTILEGMHQKRELARRLLREFDLPDTEANEPWTKTVVSERFIESLLAAPDEPTMRALVEERARLVRTLAGGDATRISVNGRPQSRDQHLVGNANPLDSKSFVETIT